MFPTTKNQVVFLFAAFALAAVCNAGVTHSRQLNRRSDPMMMSPMQPVPQHYQKYQR